MAWTSKYDYMTDDELREQPPAEIRAFVESIAIANSTEADLSPGERRLWRIIRKYFARWKKQREALARLDTKRLTP
jgi:hypothetical protein